ncbi:Amino acid adenylation domain-containing protein [Sulfidibacter corallicola]|uniref:Amino acid adenylation domain-containing protein n=1 Tax=Sulfidibacter corallicola TaxID=2818388 RepID=A0A8A4TUZ9_SULCO|nr:amino acid adenylation domain-containing protein [Sulfidibacter corallicola]QTD50355.1 amino acid adenylation domain-containing protein [Sulfidibacter corallicola]
MNQSALVGLVPLSSRQQTIWYDQVLHPSVPVYNIGMAIRIDGPIDRDLFSRAIDRVIAENDALRIRLHRGSGPPHQSLTEPAPHSLAFRDFSDRADPSRSATSWMESQFREPFELYDRPLFHFALCRTAANCHWWLLKYHHLILDGYANQLIVHRVSEVYNDLLEDRDPAASELPPSYQTFVEEDAAYLASPRYEKHKTFWLDYFDRQPTPLFAPNPSGDPHDMEAGRVSWTLAPSTYAAVRDLAAGYGGSPFHFWLGLLFSYFSLASDRDDLLIGLPILNRTGRAYKKTVGLFAGISQVWFRQDRNQSFEELLHTVKSELRGVYRAQRFPYREVNRHLIQKGIQLPYELELSYQKHDYDIRFGAAEVETHPLFNGYSRPALSVHVREFDGTEPLRVDFEYRLNQFQPNEMALLKNRFDHVIQQLLARPEEPLNALSILPERECHLIVTEFNDTGRDPRADRTTLDDIEDRARANPDRTALVFENRSLSYGQLDRRANALAHHLCDTFQLGPEQRVGVLMQRGLRLPEALLAVWKTGAAFVPALAGLPVARCAEMFADSGCRLILTDPSCREHAEAAAKGRCRVVCLDSAATERLDPPEQGPTPNTLAYIIYTSGSTGPPKGVMIEHRSLRNRLAWQQATNLIDEDSRVLLKTPVTFDVSLPELFGWARVGATVIIAPEGAEMDPGAVLQLLERERVSHVHFVPSMLGPFLDWVTHAPVRPELASLRQVFASGEALSRHLVEQFRAVLQQKYGTRLTNLYGPTEAAIEVTSHDCTPQRPGSPPIGKPIHRAKIYVLNKRRQPCPIGIGGEVYIGGIPVGRGYCGRPGLTAQAFVPDPFTPGARLYRTGDLGRFEPDGHVTYLGRNDFQVKIRGNRIETVEIEHRLTALPEIAEAKVIGRENPDRGELELVGYYRTHDGKPLDSQRLRDQLSEHLPQAWLPAHLVSLSRFPLNTAGKLDRGALPNPGATSDPSPSNRMPSTDIERQLADWWCELLGLKRVAVHDNFFTLGGHSLLLIELHLRLCRHLDRDFPLIALFERPSIYSQGQFIDQLSKPEASATPKPRNIPRHFEIPPRKIERTAYRAPTTETERLITQWWCELLNMENVGVDDNFFALGGHSLLLVRLHHRISLRLSLKFPLSALLERPSVHRQGAYIDQLLQAPSAPMEDLRQTRARRPLQPHRLHAQTQAHRQRQLDLRQAAPGRRR